MIEFAVLLHMRRNSEHRVLYEILCSEKNEIEEKRKRKMYNAMCGKNISGNLNAMFGTDISECDLNQDGPIFPIDEAIKKERRDFAYHSNYIDYIALLVFCLLFSLFNCCYWVYYLLF